MSDMPRRWRGGWYASSLHRPRLAMGSFTEGDEWVALSWGDGNSDPVWWIEWHPTGRAHALLDRLAEWRWQRQKRRAGGS